MKHKVVFIWLLLVELVSYAQQLPFYTQFRTNLVMLNPAVSGTKRQIDARMNYRQQWVGFEGAPSTQTISVNSRLMNGLMGVGGFVYKDETGPIQNITYGLDYAFHIHWPDVELSLGARGYLNQYTVNGNKITAHNGGDKAIDFSTTNTTYAPDIGAGVYFYNDRFHIGASLQHILSSRYNIFINRSDTLKKTNIENAIHVNASLGFNYSTNYDFIFQNTLLVEYVQSYPMFIAYNLTLRLKDRFLIGATVSIKDFFGMNAGYMFTDFLEAHYSYDLTTSSLSPYNSGTHEISLVFSWNKGKKRGKSEGFLHQKYRYMF